MKKNVTCDPCDTITYYTKSDINWEQYNDELVIGYVRCLICGDKIIVGDNVPMKE